jgi:hypothetical protein
MKVKKVLNTIEIYTEYKNYGRFEKVIKKNLEGFTLNTYLVGGWKGSLERSIRLEIDILENQKDITTRNIKNILDFIFKENQQFSIRLKVNNSICYPENVKESLYAIDKEFRK